MPNTTPNLGLIKPLVTEQYDIAKVTNENADKIDSLLAPKDNPTFTGVVTASRIKFPATQVPSADPNTLDDYEEGTFTPDTSTWTTQPTIKQGHYRKIGSVVHVYILFNGGVIPSGGAIYGLPFPIMNDGVSIRYNVSSNIGDVCGGFSINNRYAINYLASYNPGNAWYTIGGTYFSS